MNDINDFEIKKGVLVRYKGSDAEVVIPNGVTSIGNGAFKECNDITSVIIPEGVTTIEGSAFFFCHNLKKIEIPDSVQNIGWGAFNSCSSLENVTIPEGVTTIEADTFCDCSSLKSINIPNSVTSIGKRAFSRCSKIKSVTIPDSVTFIGDSNLYSNAAFGSAVFDENTEVIFNSFTLPNYYNGSHRMVFKNTPIQEIMNKDYKRYAANGFLTTNDLSIYDERIIGSYKKYFKGKTVNYIDFIVENDTSKIVERLASLGLLDKSFVDMISQLNIPEEVWTTINGYTSSPDSDSRKNASSISALKKIWKYEKNEDGVTITAYKSGGESVVIPDKIGKDIVTEIGAEAFSPDKKGLKPEQRRLCSSIKSVVIPGSVTSIGEKAFDHCQWLKSVTIPDSVTSIGDYTFSRCLRLSDVTIPNSVTSIGEKAFGWCTSLKGIMIPDSVRNIGKSAFAGCTLANNTIPKSMTSIGEEAFYACKGLENITITNDVTSIGKRAFCGCEDLKNIIIPNSVISIGEYAFEECANLTIHGQAGSVAEQYAKKNNIPFEPM